MRTIGNCARIWRARRAVSGVPVASGNGHIVGHGNSGIVRIVAEFEEATIGTENTRVLTRLDPDWVPRDVCDVIQRIFVRIL